MTPLPDRFEIHTDRAAVYRRVKRALQWHFVLVALLAAAVAGGIGTLVPWTGVDGRVFGGIVGALGGLMVVLGTLLWMLLDPIMWLLRREIPVPLAADAAGVWMAAPGTAAGWVRLPWPAVASVRTYGRGAGAGVVVTMRRDVRPDAPGLGGLDDAVTVTAARRGIRVSTVGTEVDARTVRAVLDGYARAAAGVPA